MNQVEVLARGIHGRTGEIHTFEHTVVVDWDLARTKEIQHDFQNIVATVYKEENARGNLRIGDWTIEVSSYCAFYIHFKFNGEAL